MENTNKKTFFYIKKKYIIVIEKNIKNKITE